MMASTYPQSHAAPQSDHFYSPWQITRLLRELPQLLTPQGRREEPEPIRNQRSGTKTSWDRQEDALIKHADLTQALEALPSFTRMCVVKTYVMGESDKHVATILGCDRETVARHRRDGVEMMSWSLGYRGDVAQWRTGRGRR